MIKELNILGENDMQITAFTYHTWGERKYAVLRVRVGQVMMYLRRVATYVSF